MAGETEAGDVSQGADAFQLPELDARRVELSGRGNHRGIARRIKLLLLQRSGKNSYPQWFAEYQFVARLRARIALQVFWVHQADRHQAIDRLDRIDGVAAGNRDTRFFADGFATIEYLFDGFERQRVDGHAHQRQRKQRRAAHRIYI